MRIAFDTTDREVDQSGVARLAGDGARHDLLVATARGWRDDALLELVRSPPAGMRRSRRAARFTGQASADAAIAAL